MTNILEQLEEKMRTGTEEEVRLFVAQHLSELPEDLQQELVVDLFKEAIADEQAEQKAVTALKQEMADAIDVIEVAEKMQKEN